MERMPTVLIGTAMVPYHATHSRSWLVPQWTVVLQRPLEVDQTEPIQQPSHPAELQSSWPREISWQCWSEVVFADLQVSPPTKEDVVAVVCLGHLVLILGWLLLGYSLGALLHTFPLVGVHLQDSPLLVLASLHLLLHLLLVPHPTLPLLSSSLHQPAEFLQLLAWARLLLPSSSASSQSQEVVGLITCSSAGAGKVRNATAPQCFPSSRELSNAWKGQLQIRICSNAAQMENMQKDIKWWSGS